MAKSRGLEGDFWKALIFIFFTLRIVKEARSMVMMMMMAVSDFLWVFLSISLSDTAEATAAVTNVINYVDSSCDVMGEGACVIRQKDTSLTFRK